jgi:3-oxoacyl-[acyl-carrier protein] reductase
MRITGKTALVLGATKGIGKAIALRLAENGAQLIVPYFDWPEDSRQTISELKEQNPHHQFIKTDLRDLSQIEDLFQQIQEQHNCLDILINNIERCGMPVVHGAYTPEQWDLEIETTLKAKWWVFQQALPMLKKNGKTGAVVTISSIAGTIGRTGPAGQIFNEGYAAANRAISSFTETWARQAAPNVRVNELILGFVESRHGEGTRGWELLSDKQKKAICDHTLLGRTGKLKEVCDTILFLIKDATFMTGTTIRFDGGYTLGHSQVPEMPESQNDLAVKI